MSWIMSREWCRLEGWRGNESSMAPMKFPKNEPPYADDGNWNKISWWQKGGWKKILRKKWIRERLRDSGKE